LGVYIIRVYMLFFGFGIWKLLETPFDF